MEFKKFTLLEITGNLKNAEEFAKLYKARFNEELCLDCPGKLEEAHAKFYKSAAPAPASKVNTSAQFQLKPDKVINGPFGSYNALTITDEIAKKILAKHPALEREFLVIEGKVVVHVPRSKEKRLVTKS